MNNLTDELLIEAYLAAVEHRLDCDFISLLLSEIKDREIATIIKQRINFKEPILF